MKSNLEKVIHNSINKDVFGAVVGIESGDHSFAWFGSAGNLNQEDRYFIASTTKLYITATILKLRELGYLTFQDNISKYIPNDILSGLHSYRGTDYSFTITIGHLLSHTSGLPDYFQQVRASGKSLQEELVSGHDQSWTFEQVMDDVKRMKPRFTPGEKGKALYSDTNYQLLGKIIEIVSHQKINDCLKQFIYDPLQLKNTYLYEGKNDSSPVSLYYKSKPLHIPLAMASFGPDGGIVSTVKESMIFIRAFFEGMIFPKSYLHELFVWRNIFFPLQYGYGIARFKLPRIFSPFKSFPELIGHSGLSGAFAYYCPEKNIYMTGTINQISDPSLSYKLMIKLLNGFG